MTAQVQLRLNLLYEGFQRLRAAGFRVEAVAPQGAIYLSVQVAIHGRRLPPEHGGGELRTNEQVRHYLLDAAGLAVVPFQAFGMQEESGWFRLSVGAISKEEIPATLERLERALSAVAPATSAAA